MERHKPAVHHFSLYSVKRIRQTKAIQMNRFQSLILPNIGVIRGRDVGVFNYMHAPAETPVSTCPKDSLRRGLYDACKDRTSPCINLSMIPWPIQPPSSSAPCWYMCRLRLGSLRICCPDPVNPTIDELATTYYQPIMLKLPYLARLRPLGS